MGFFAQGDREKELGLEPMALYDRIKSPPIPKAQLGFLNFVIVPYWKYLFQILGTEGSEPMSKCLKANLVAWQALKAKAEGEAEAEKTPDSSPEEKTPASEGQEKTVSETASLRTAS